MQAILAGSRPERSGGDTFRRMVVVGDHDPEPTDDACIVMSPADKVHVGHHGEARMIVTARNPG
jgi:hypothetical protein